MRALKYTALPFVVQHTQIKKKIEAILYTCQCPLRAVEFLVPQV